jgi:hypothetical protein
MGIRKYISKLSERFRRNRLPKDAQDRYEAVDKIEQEMMKHEQVICPIENIFTPGLYTRVITVPTGTLLTTEIHKTEHPFFMLKGICEVVDVETGKTTLLKAPHIGVTQPYTRRVINVIEETIWATAHVTDETDIEKIGDKIVVQRDNVLSQYKLNENKTLHS